MSNLTWEQAVQWLRQQPDQEALVRACYYDDPLIQSAQRFADSEEWQAVANLLPKPPGSVLDLGAGRGISSYALARDGWQVTALEPDPGAIVGAGAIRELAEISELPIEVHQNHAEDLPFTDKTFDAVYARQVLHHASDLSLLCREVARVLKPGGIFIATREHVISRPDDLEKFLNKHPLHHLYGGENAYLLDQYRAAISGNGLHIVKVLGPFDSVINYFPMTIQQWREYYRALLSSFLGYKISFFLTDQQHLIGQWVLKCLAHRFSSTNHTPGRLYSFVAQKRTNL